MALNFTKTNVAAGEPVTAQAWNAIVDTLFEVQTILLAGTGTVRVAVTGDQRDIDAAHVVATDANGVRNEAAPQTAPGDQFVFPRLPAGAYTVSVSAPSCTTATAGVTVASNGTATPTPVPITLVFTGKRMPNVLGVHWKDAVGTLAAVSPLALDASGKGVPLTGFDAAYADMPVLMQWPDPDEIVPAGKTPYVIVATIVKPPAIVATPNLIGKTIGQAQAILAAAGLQLKSV